MPPNLKEPFPSAHPNDRSSLHPFSNPRNTVLFGAALILAGVVLTLEAVQGYIRDDDPAALWVGALVFVGFTAVGAWGVHVGVTRLRWIRRFRDEYGFSPFDRRPDDAVPPRSRNHG